MRKAKAPSKDFLIDGAFLRSKLLAWYQLHERPLPWRVMFKKHGNPWHIWVSEIMLQQTVIKAVLPVYERFIAQFPSPQTLAEATSEDIRLAVRGLGYYRRFDLLHKACKKLLDENRPLPRTHDEWLMLPGIGAYTAAAISSIAFNQPHGVVDGNVERVLCRLLDIRTEPNLPHLKKQFKIIMDDLCSSGDAGALNQAVMELGQSICTPTNPNCKQCPLTKKCQAFANSSQSLAPAPKAKQEFVDVHLQLKIIQCGDKIALLQRPSDAKFLKGSWGFPTSILQGKTLRSDGQLSANVSPNLSSLSLAKIGTIKHSITKHKISADVMLTHVKKLPSALALRLAHPSDVEQSLVSNLDRKAWHLFLREYPTAH